MMQTRRLRRLAVHVLLAWLFALGAGFVNACVVQMELRNSAHPVEHGKHETVKAPTKTAVHDASAHEHEHEHERESDAGNPPCERFCDEPSVVTQAAKQQSDSPSDFWLASAPALSFNYQPISEAGDRSLNSKPIRWHATIPISIAFLRLTL